MDALPKRYVLPILDAESVFCELMPYAQARMLPEEVARLQRAIHQVRPLLGRLSSQPPDFGLCHADLAFVNLRLAEDGRVTFFDFAEAKFTWRTVDLASCTTLLQRRVPHEATASLWDAVVADIPAFALVQPGWSSRCR